jgi:hypothetical protein
MQPVERDCGISSGASSVAGYPRAMPSPSDGKRSTPSLRLRSYALETEVERLLREKRYELAVLLSQTLLELRVEAELVDYFEILREKRFGDAALGLLSSYNIGNGRVQTFFERLIDAKLRDADAEAMSALRAHVERRNGVAQRGDQATEEDARASLAAVLAVSQLVHELSYRSLGLDDVLEEEARQERGDDEDYEDDEDWR